MQWANRCFEGSDKLHKLLICRMLQVMRRYHIQDRDDYKKYNKLCGFVTKVTSALKRLSPQDAGRIEMTDQLLDK